MQIIDEIDGALGGVDGKSAIDALLKIVCYSFGFLMFAWHVSTPVATHKHRHTNI